MKLGITKIKPKTARCILYRDSGYLLAVHSSFWGRRKRRWGIPGGSIEWRESPEQAARRELREELYIDVPNMVDLGEYRYKRAPHQVLAAHWPHDIDDYDDHELLDLQWFSTEEVFQLETDKLLHAGYEADAIRDLMNRLG